MLRQFRRVASSAWPKASSSSKYIGQMFEAYTAEPESVHPAWKKFFESGSSAKPTTSGQSEDGFEIADSQRLASLYLIYANQGHSYADINPLQPRGGEEDRPTWLDYRAYGFTENDLDREFLLATGINGIGELRPDGIWTLRDYVAKLNEVYCGKVSFEYGHIQSRVEKNWIRQRIETQYPKVYTKDQKIAIHKLLQESNMLDEFLHTKFQTVKRYGLEGLDGIIVSLNAIIEQAAKNGVEEVVIGTAHRGRFNILENILKYDTSLILGHFADTVPYTQQVGDVMYHLSATGKRVIDGKTIEISLLPNPSHLEAVNPVVQGNIMSKQNRNGDPKKSLGIIIHGDGACAGQGIVYESIQMQDLNDYTTAGTIHIVANNNIGFTAESRDTRSTLYTTDIGKTVAAPCFHINGDEVEQIDWVSRLATDYRQEFQTDIFIDVLGYRKYGHNEVDDPTITNPSMYKKIQAHEKISSSYTKKLIGENVIDEMYNATLMESKNRLLNQAYEKAKSFPDNRREAIDMMERVQFKQPEIKKFDFSIDVEELRQLGIKASTLPEDIEVHPLVRRNYADRLKAIKSGEGLAWALGESLVWAQMLSQGIPVRISGEDVERGTFSHRHAVIYDQKVDQKKYAPLNNLHEGQARFLAANSHLSEMGVLGFDYGYSMDSPNGLTIWEAQFGDFANGAQIIIDQFIANGEAKWGTHNGMVLLLPHGYDGQGPEHSSCRIERYLSLSGDDPNEIPDYTKPGVMEYYNIRVVMPSTPANLANFLKRQLARDFRRPLIVASPKRLLRHKLAVSSLEEIASGRVYRVIDEVDENVKPDNVRKVIFCCGQIYYDLFEERIRLNETGNHDDIALVRVEQLCPFPFDRVSQVISKYPNAEFTWVQEEARNGGAYSYLRPRFITCLKAQDRGKLGVISRPSGAATATGYADVNKQQLRDILTEAFS